MCVKIDRADIRADFRGAHRECALSREGLTVKTWLAGSCAALAAVAVLPAIALAGGQSDGSVTFAKDVAPILYKNCVDCHRPTMFAPMSLTTYEDARPWARAIKQRVVRKEMPPWSADAPMGTFKNDPRLSQKEIDTIVAWVDSGAARGNDRDMPQV